ncbi:hypothetical protein [Salibacterium halotolerans]|uniref:Phage DNA packaging protein, Nu1 subunit of terminase n=1 Tax=Salibacterium halotolerans TaxID=1884432 RepID=A0A1I5MM69_9BACI|nr:hypothetical protein [Salibacterium halotolerans]SFP10649.1 Phage DNA packaging protein, Nu1 subunit of terminase [Salibacterium halotolerans]
MARKDLKENNYLVTTAEISEILGLSKRRIQQLVQEKALVRVSHGKFDLPSSINSYFEYKMEKMQTEDDLDKNKEAAKWTRAKREKTELEVKIMRGELHRGKDVERVMSDMLGAFRARLLSFPSKYAPQVLGKTEIPPIKEKLKDGIYEALNELSEYDPYVFFDQSKDKLYLEEEEEDPESEVALMEEGPEAYERKQEE